MRLLPLFVVLEQGESYLGWLKADADYQDQVVAASFLPPRRGERAEPAGTYAPLLDRLGIIPWAHQSESLALTEAGEDVVIATPTASGKSLCFQIPALDAAGRERNTLYLSPTKALARDQLDRLRALAAAASISGVISPYDGDTRAAQRREARAAARVIVTNPDMLHYGMLAWHHAWARFLGGLELIVLDELHSYRGVMGAHVANIVRRLLRICAHYGANPRVTALSATIANPAEHLYSLTGRPGVAVTTDTATSAPRELIFWQPALLPGDSGRRRSSNSEAAALARRFARAGLRSIFFCNSRKGAELLRRYASDGLDSRLAHTVQSYRSGYTQEDRRLIEQGFRNGDITVLMATSALELGMDIGGVDAVVLVGWPGSHMAMWQRVGRAGRAGQRSLAMLIPAADPLDEYYVQHPDLVTDGTPESASADPFNSVIHPLHLACAAAELPLLRDDPLIAPDLDLGDVAGITPVGDRWVSEGRRPHRRVAVRGTGPGRLRLIDGLGTLIGETSLGNALREVHPGAVYLHKGEAWLVASLDLGEGVAVMLPHLGDWYTQPRSETDIDVLDAGLRLPFGNLSSVSVTHSVTGYALRRHYSEATLDERLLDLPPSRFETKALHLPCGHLKGVVPAALLPSGLHALEHTLIGLLPAFVLCERADIGGVSYPAYGTDAEPCIFIYDGYPGGVGYVSAGAGRFGEWLGAAKDLLRDCRCSTGCPRCILSPKCGNGNQFLDKAAALALADAWLAGSW